MFSIYRLTRKSAGKNLAPCPRCDSGVHAVLQEPPVNAMHAVLRESSSAKSSLSAFFICVNAACMLLVVLWLAQWQAATGAQASPAKQGAQQIKLSQEMDRLSGELEAPGKLKEWPDARNAISHPGYVLLTSTLEYVGGNDYEEYFALFSEEASTQGKRAPLLIGWAMVPAPFRFERLSFEVQTNAAGEKYLRLSLADGSGESSTSGEAGFVEYLLPGQDAWGAELGK